MGLTITVFRNVGHIPGWQSLPRTAIDPATGELYSTSADDSSLPPQELRIARRSRLGNLSQIAESRAEIANTRSIATDSVLLGTILESAFNSGTTVSTNDAMKLRSEIRALFELRHPFSRDTISLLEEVERLCETSLCEGNPLVFT